VQDGVRARQFVTEGVRVTRVGQCTLEPGATKDTTSAGTVEVVVDFACPEVRRPVRIELNGMLGRLAAGHRHLSGEQVAFASNSSMVLTPAHAPLARAMVATGIEHILTGFDHVLFVLALLLGLGSLRTTLYAVTAFTVGHSLTLVATVVTQWAPSPKWVEPLIALSIVYVAVENLVALSRSRPNTQRWLVAGVFGLVHGLGFAGALRDVAVSGGALPRAILGFNVGVELGQLMILVPAMALLHFAATKPQVRRAAVAVCSLLVALPGAFWFVTRVSEALS
jgi:hypothetical protein